MSLKYEQLDAELFSWLHRHPRRITTARAVHALGITNTTAKRHISRRFSQLEDRGTLVCELQGTARVCEVAGQIPSTLSKEQVREPVPEPVNQNILANNSEEFVAASGVIEHLPAAWDDPEQLRPKGSLPLGIGAYATTAYGTDVFI